MKNKPVLIFTDGACRGNPGPGAWAYLLRYGTYEKEGSGVEEHTTNNRMELRAAIEALLSLKRPCEVVLTTDSNYLKQGIEEWVFTWQKNGWKNQQKQPVKNQDLWQALLNASKPHQVEWQWVRGHNGHPDNERVDALANQALDRGL